MRMNLKVPCAEKDEAKKLGANFIAAPAWREFAFRDGRLVTGVRQFVADHLRREQVAGHVGADVDVDLVAEMMVRVSASFLTTPSGIVDLDDEAQLADLARRFLVPMLG